MKLMIQIPCFNEAYSLAETLAALPRAVDGFDCVEYLIVDDGSDDETVEVARRHGVHHIVRHLENRGLAAAFMTGITSCLVLGADVIVSTDGDNQYFGGDIPAVVAPVREGRADFAMGVRPIRDRRYFPLWKSVLT
ncbi:MAG: glycosyltransferase family 2 protein, partial [Lysobacteraceae bacterium]